MRKLADVGFAMYGTREAVRARERRLVLFSTLEPGGEPPGRRNQRRRSPERVLSELRKAPRIDSVFRRLERVVKTERQTLAGR